MASLSNILGKRTGPFVTESNIEQGELYVFNGHLSKGELRTPHNNCTCFNSPGTGMMQIEMWGAGGSGGKMCCCGTGLPGNPGTYLKRTICVDSDTWFHMRVGKACANDTLCFQGCSQASCLLICSPNGLLSETSNSIGNANCQCLCAEGGHGGHSFCMEGECTILECFVNRGFCWGRAHKNHGINCGIVCNMSPYHVVQRAYGGDINCNSGDPDQPGSWSCSTFLSYNPNNKCCKYDNVSIPPGIFSTQWDIVTYLRECYSNQYNGVGDGAPQLIQGLSALGMNTQAGGFINADCWENSRGCGCYEYNACLPNLPAGVPGPGASPAGDVRDHTWRGGSGLIRMRFIGA